VNFERLDAVVAQDFGLGAHAIASAGTLGAVDVGVEQAYAMAEFG